VNRRKIGGIYGKIKKVNPIAEYKNSIQFEKIEEFQMTYPESKRT
jgi:hypothetical protein